MQEEAAPGEAAEDRFSEALDRRAADRRWRRQRPLYFLGLALLAMLLLVNVLLAVSLSNVRGELDEVRAVAAPPRDAEVTGVTEEDITDLRARIQELRREIAERDDPPSGATDEGETARLQEDVARTRAYVRCTDRALRQLDRSLRQLLTRDLDPNAYVQSDDLPDCP